MNLLPAGFGPTEEAGPRDPDLNIFSYDCTTLFANQFVALLDPDDDGIQKYRPFLARSSAGPVTAGLVALLRSVNPEASPAEIKEILRETSHSMEYRGRLATHVPDAFEAVTRAVGFSVVL
jgi:subtilisin family serine protease